MSLLGFFKYSGFIFSNLNHLFRTNFYFHEYALPIGISFYAFQTISYVVDVYKGEVKAQKSPFKLLLFVSLFHQPVAGPIVRYKDISGEIEKRVVTAEKFSYGINRFVMVLGKKVFFAIALLACTPLVSMTCRKIYTGFSSSYIGATCIESMNSVLNVVILLAATILLVGKTYNLFLYFRF